MSRLLRWISGLVNRGAGEKARLKAIVRARRLGFESCEQRFALSTTIWALSVDDWGVEGAPLLEGGSITLTFAATELLPSQGLAEPFASFEAGSMPSGSIRSALEHGERSSLSGYGFPPLNEETFAGVAPAQHALNHFGFFDYTLDGDYTLTLSDASFQATATSGELAVIPMPAPSVDAGEPEGGLIALTPFTAPTSLGLASGEKADVLARNDRVGKPRRFEPTQRELDATPVETLRGRAVMYEVADANRQPEKRPNGDAQTALEEPRRETLLAAFWLIADGGGGTEAPSTESGRAAGIAVGFTDGMPIAHRSASSSSPRLGGWAHADARLADSAGATTIAQQPDETAPPTADVYDAALAAWQEEDRLAPETALVLAAPTADRSRYAVGWAAALSLGAFPLHRAWRRRSLNRSHEQIPPEQLQRYRPGSA